MNFTFLVTFQDGTSKEVDGTAVDLVAFEAEFDISVSNLGQGKVTHLLWLTWHVEKRLGNSKESFQKWVESVSTVEARAPKK